MSLKCPNCQTPVSKKWLLFGLSSTDYVCPKCRHTLRWTGYRLLANLLVGIIFGMPILLAYYEYVSYIEILPFLLLMGAFLLLYFPKQFKDMGR